MILSSATLTGVTEKPSIFEDVDYECGTDSTSFPLAEKLRLFNKWYLKIGMFIWQNASDWKFDDKNATTLPKAYDDLVANQADYALPTTALSVEEVYVKDLNGNYIKLEYKDLSEYGYDPDNDDSGMPKFWDLQGYSVVIYPKPAASSVNTNTDGDGLKMILSRRVSKLTNTSAAVEPGIEEEFNDYICKGISYDFKRIKRLFDSLPALREDLKELKDTIKNYYANRESVVPRVSRKKVSYS